jgi:hypothetical protein
MISQLNNCQSYNKQGHLHLEYCKWPVVSCFVNFLASRALARNCASCNKTIISFFIIQEKINKKVKLLWKKDTFTVNNSNQNNYFLFLKLTMLMKGQIMKFLFLRNQQMSRNL